MWNYWKFQLHWHKLEWVNPRNKIRRKKPIQFFLNISKGDRTSHWVGHSKIKELDINDLFERKDMIENLEAELTEA